jgi:hypothetical protein
MDLPSKERTFDFDYVGLDTGKEYKGRFTVRCILTVGQKHAMSLERTRLLGNYENPTPDLSGIALILSTLRSKVIDAPEWWKQSQGGSLIEDEDCLVNLYRKVEEAEELWKADLRKKAEPPQVNQDSTLSNP